MDDLYTVKDKIKPNYRTTYYNKLSIKRMKINRKQLKNIS